MFVFYNRQIIWKIMQRIVDYLETVEVNCNTERDCDLVRPSVPFTNGSGAVVNPKIAIFRNK